jgi:hypothetical protein
MVKADRYDASIFVKQFARQKRVLGPMGNCKSLIAAMQL